MMAEATIEIGPDAVIVCMGAARLEVTGAREVAFLKRHLAQAALNIAPAISEYVRQEDQAIEPDQNISMARRQAPLGASVRGW